MTDIEFALDWVQKNVPEVLPPETKTWVSLSPKDLVLFAKAFKAVGSKKKDSVITIPAPIVNRGDKCMVHNYRRGPRDMANRGIWEKGIVRGLRWENAFGSFRWSYDVVTDRPAACVSVRLTVGDAGVRPLKTQLVFKGEKHEMRKV